MFSPKINQRMELRPIEAAHTAELYRLVDSNREHLRRWHPWVDGVRSAEDLGKRIIVWQEQQAAKRGFTVGIWFDGHLCGVIGLVSVDWQNRWAALSYWLDERHQGRGIMTTCCRAVVANSFKTLQLNRITIECATDNARSRAIPERLGFRLEGIARGVEWLQDRYADHAIYGLLRSDWGSGTSPIIPKAEDGVPATKTTAAPDSRLVDSFDRTLKIAFELHNGGRSREAEALCRVLMQIRSQDSQLLFLLGMVLHKTGQDEEAVKWLTVAAHCGPRDMRIFSGLGCAYQGLKDHERAIAAFEKAREIDPKSADTCYNLGNSCYQLDQVGRAESLFRRAVELNPRDSASWNNLGKCLKELNRLDESIAAYDRAIEIAPDYAMARYGRGVALLTAGRFVEGFRDYESRYRPPTARQFTQPAWTGERAPEKTLFLHAEQGFGDAIQTIRFISTARERVGRVILECRPELATLFQHAKCADVVLPHGETIPEFDFVISLASLPHALGVTLESIPGKSPYLEAPPAEALPAAPAGHLKVGLVWAGNPGHHQDAARSIPFNDLAPLLKVAGVRFYSLQQTVPARDESFLQSVGDVIDTSLKFPDFLETASIIANLDLVVTVDTAVAHLAGALGKPVWMLLQHSPDWRWFLNRADTPWYPSMRLFRQGERGRWDLPVKRVTDALRRMAIPIIAHKRRGIQKAPSGNGTHVAALSAR